MRKFLTRKVLMGLAGAVALGGGAVAVRAFADTSWTWSDANTFVSEGHWRRLGASQVACAGRCTTVTTDGLHRRTCPLTPAMQTSVANCLTALSAACTSACESEAQ